MFEYLKVSKQTQYNIIFQYIQLSKYAMTIAHSSDSTGYPLNVQTWFQSDPNVHGLSTNVLKMYFIKMLFNVQSMFIFGHLKNVHLMQKFSKSVRNVLLSLT